MSGHVWKSWELLLMLESVEVHVQMLTWSKHSYPIRFFLANVCVCVFVDFCSGP